MTFDNLLLENTQEMIMLSEEKQLRNVFDILVSANFDNDGNYHNGALDFLLLSTKLIVYKQKGEMEIITKRRKLHVRAFKQ